MKRILAIFLFCCVASLGFGMDFTITSATTAIGAGTVSRQFTLTLTGSGTLGAYTQFSFSDGGAGGSFYAACSGCDANTAGFFLGASSGVTAYFVYIAAAGASGNITLTATPSGGFSAAHGVTVSVDNNASVVSQDNFSGTAGTALIGRAATTGGTWNAVQRQRNRCRKGEWQQWDVRHRNRQCL